MRIYTTYLPIYKNIHRFTYVTIKYLYRIYRNVDFVVIIKAKVIKRMLVSIPIPT